MNVALILTAILIGLLLGWLWGRFSQRQRARRLPKPYLEGLNYLLNEQADQAIDVFIKLLAADDETVETHFALGQLFRRRGEVDRAIKIHQHILARPQLDKMHKQLALYALGKDYLHAGVFDRAERVFQELSRSDRYRVESLQELLNIYEQEHEWEKALAIAEQLQKHEPAIATKIAHYYCELALGPQYKSQLNQQIQALKKALSIDKNCARASLLLGHLLLGDQQYKLALKTYLKIEEQVPALLPQAFDGMLAAYDALEQRDKFYQLLQMRLAKQQDWETLMRLVDFYVTTQGDAKAQAFLLQQVERSPHLLGLQTLLHWQAKHEDPQTALSHLAKIAQSITHDQHPYACHYCGFTSKTLHWHCPGCRHWASILPVQLA